MTIGDLKREDIEAFIRFCQRPPKAWIGLKKPPRFVEVEGERRPNPEWRSFVATVSKAAFKKGQRPVNADDALSNGATKETLAILICALYSLYLRISELAASARWTPAMNDFHQDHEGLWWFTTVGKGNIV